MSPTGLMDYAAYDRMIHDVSTACPGAVCIRGEVFAQQTVVRGDGPTGVGISSRLLARKFGGMLEGDDTYPDVVMAPGVHLPPGRKGFALDGLGTYATHGFAFLHEVGHHLDPRRGESHPDADYRSECRADGFAVVYAIAVLGMDPDAVQGGVAISRARGLDGGATPGALLHYTEPFLDKAVALGKQIRDSGTACVDASGLQSMARAVDTCLTDSWSGVRTRYGHVCAHPDAYAMPADGAYSPMQQVAFARGAAKDVPSSAVGIRLWPTWSAMDESARTGVSMSPSVVSGHLGRLSRDPVFNPAQQSALADLRRMAGDGVAVWSKVGDITRTQLSGVCLLCGHLDQQVPPHVGMLASSMAGAVR